MSESKRSCLGNYDFSTAFPLSLADRLERCVREVTSRHARSGYTELCEIPPVPETGASEEELVSLERELGVRLPTEYRAFLGRWRYLDLGTGLVIWGLDHEGVSLGRPWRSDTHSVPGSFLVFGDFWRFADGDQLMFPLDGSTFLVLLYLHEERPPAIEPFAPSFSLALWRMVFEDTRGG